MTEPRQLYPIIQKDTITALELAEAVTAAVQAEPSRLRQCDWVKYADTEVPCGTSACQAGWAVLLTGLRPLNDHMSCIAFLLFMGIEAPEDANSEAERDRAHDLRRAFSGHHGEDEERGTAAYVEAASAPFREWVDEHRRFLASRVIHLPTIRAFVYDHFGPGQEK